MSAKLTKREHECIVHIMSGMTAKEIAKKLELSPRTVEYYIKNVKTKFSCKTKAELVVKTYSLLLTYSV